MMMVVIITKYYPLLMCATSMIFCFKFLPIILMKILNL